MFFVCIKEKTEYEHSDSTVIIILFMHLLNTCSALGATKRFKYIALIKPRHTDTEKRVVVAKGRGLEEDG